MTPRNALVSAVALATGLSSLAAAEAGERFTARSLRGTYGISGSGTLNGAPATVIGLNSFDGAGGCEITASLNQGGGLIPLASTLCSYIVNADGTGTTTVTFSVPEGILPDGDLLGPFVSSFVIVNRNEVPFVLGDGFGGGTVASGVAKRQSGQD